MQKNTQTSATTMPAPQGGDVESTPEGMNSLQYARGLFELLNTPTTNQLLMVAAQAIECLARDLGAPLHEACDAMIVRALAAKEAGVRKWIWWFTDSKWDTSVKTVTPEQNRTVVGMTLAERHRRSLESA
jgi:hypothetical protein